MRIDVLTIFPGMFDAVLNESIVKRAQEKGKIRIYTHDLRDFTSDKHRKVDDRPFGGGSGMVMRVEPIYNCLKSLKRLNPRVILLCPKGKKFNQGAAKRISKLKNIVLICGHYEGVDERVRKAADEEISIGDYVLTGGELPAMVLIDAVVRLIPGVLGDKNSLNFESFEGNLLEYPHYTRPADFCGMQVPDVLLSGDHTKIALWRKIQALKTTRSRRKDLLK